MSKLGLDLYLIDTVSRREDETDQVQLHLPILVGCGAVLGRSRKTPAYLRFTPIHAWRFEKSDNASNWKTTTTTYLR